MIDRIENFVQVLDVISFDTWLVLDLDNTVMEPIDALGGDQWFYSLMKFCSQPGVNKDVLFISAITLYNAVQEHIKIKPVEVQTAYLIRALQDIGIPVIALTARSVCIKNETNRQLADIGIDFEIDPIIVRKHTRAKLKHMYHEGIIYCDGKNKGEALGHFFKSCRITPQHVVMLDDKQSHLENVAFVMKQMKIRFHGLRYSFLDDQLHQFDHQAANKQLRSLKERLPHQARESIKHLGLPIHDDHEEESQHRHPFFASKHVNPEPSAIECSASASPQN